MTLRPVLMLLASSWLFAAGAPVRAQTEDAGATESVAPLLGADEAALLEPAVDVGALRSTPAPAPQPPPAATPPPVAPAATPPPVARTGATTGRALDTLDLGTTSITGNQELPKVLYIVPWKQSDLGDVVGRPVNTLLDEVLAPIDPEVFERQLGYYDTLNEASREE